MAGTALQFVVNPEVFHLACGPLGLAAITASGTSEVLKF
jgi:hypothetical protein